MTLGTGTLGGTSTTDSVTYTHLVNIKRVAYGAARAFAIAAVVVVSALSSNSAAAPITAEAPRETCWVSGDVAGDANPILVLKEQEKTQACR
jgi:hypothetical protein